MTVASIDTDTHQGEPQYAATSETE